MFLSRITGSKGLVAVEIVARSRRVGGVIIGGVSAVHASVSTGVDASAGRCLAVGCLSACRARAL